MQPLTASDTTAASCIAHLSIIMHLDREGPFPFLSHSYMCSAKLHVDGLVVILPLMFAGPMV